MEALVSVVAEEVMAVHLDDAHGRVDDAFVVGATDGDVPALP
jgi:hypothetical protein